MTNSFLGNVFMNHSFKKVLYNKNFVLKVSNLYRKSLTL